jgi:hypothetical protein
MFWIGTLRIGEELKMRRLILGLLVVLTASAALAGGWCSTYSLASGSVDVTNTQANSSWVPVAVLLKFDAVTNSVMTVQRVSQSNTFVLGSANVSNVTSTVWTPEADYPFSFGDVLRVTSTATNGQVQIIRRAE